MSDTTDPILHTLTATHALLAEGPERWTKGKYAKDVRGNEVSTKSSEACSFCLYGAMQSISKDDTDAIRARRFVIDNLHLRWLSDFNDDPATTYADVLAVLTRSIDARREEIGGA